MLHRKIITGLLSGKYKIQKNYIPQRNVQVSVIGAAGDIGSNLALLLKHNYKIERLNLYDDEDRVRGVGMELGCIPGGPFVSTYTGDNYVAPAVRSSHIIVMVTRVPRKPGHTRDEMVAANAPAVLKVCRAIVDHNPHAFFALSTNPINSIVPFACALMQKYNSYNPFKIFGITHIDTARSRSFAGNALQINPRHLDVPVIGGHSDGTIIPLYSNISPSYYVVDACQADTLTRLVRKAGTEVVIHKYGRDSATLAMAWSINEFVDHIVDAVLGNQVVVHAFTANPHFGTRFFAGPVTVGPCGITQTSNHFTMNEYETYLLNCAVPVINRDVFIGEDYIQFMEYAGKN